MTSELKQALDQLAAVDFQAIFDITLIEEAAGLVVLLKEDCQTCEGASPFCSRHHHIPTNNECSTVCDVCLGRGWVPTDQAIELQAEAFYDDDDSYPEKWEHQIEDVKDWYRQKSRVGLVAVLSMGDTE